MKTKSFLAIAILAAFSIVSCGTKDKSVTEKLVGVWTGIDTIQIASIDSLGNIAIETIAVPIAIEYFADTTMSGKVSSPCRSWWCRQSTLWQLEQQWFQWQCFPKSLWMQSGLCQCQSILLQVSL